MRKGHTLDSVIEYIIAMLAILDCNSVYTKLIGSKFTTFSPYIAMSLALLLVLKLNKTSVTVASLYRMIVFVLIYYLGIGFIYVNNASTSPSPLGFVAKYILAVPFLILIFWLDRDSAYSIFNKYTNCMFVIAIISLFCWLFFSQLRVSSPTTYFYVNWGKPYRYPVYWYIYVERQVEVFFGHRIIRNIGFFTEAPMYSACLTIAMILELFVGNKSKVKTYVFFLTIVTTFATTGLLLGIVIYIMNFILLRADTRNQFWVKLLFGTTIMVVGGVAFSAIFIQKATSTVSWSGRLLSISEGYKVMKDNPLFGCGYKSFKAYLKYMPAYRVRANMGVGGSASGIGSLMGQCGLLLTGFYINSFIIYILSSRKGKYLKDIFLAVTMLAMLFFAVIQYSLIMLIIISFFYVSFICRQSKKGYQCEVE